MADAQTIHGKDLEALLKASGIELGERRLRQLATEEGLYPEPQDGQYELVPTLVGLVKYYRAQKGKRSKEFEAQEFRKLKESADEIAIRNETSRGRLICTDAVYRENEKLFVALKARILASALSDVEKDELLADLVQITARNLAEPQKLSADPPPPGSGVVPATAA